MSNKLKIINQDSNLSLSSAHKISTLSKFSHELKTPLHGILGLAKFLEKNWPSVPEEKKQECITSIIDAAQTMTVILDLMMKNVESKENINFIFETIDIVSIFRKIVTQFAQLHLSQKNINLEYISNQDEIIIKGDEFWLKQVLTNILSNAYIYAQSGVVKVIVDSNKKADNYCSIIIEDQGPGIPSQFLETIFSPFHRVKGGNKNSTGLGLSICKEIIEAHGGTIYAQNNSQKGTSIEINLPLA
ncbi:MAG: HAMP domain-containing histidine kinase [Rickettsiaceae bacterium]|nr:HAMP domain-containing histidine kinase [Rickettsiaceae bacterium]